eukprot:m.55573 g.55573  ORF g.55573 m.55573 type:complete len:99 (+) comp34491_c0_seq4:479-775(+)
MEHWATFFWPFRLSRSKVSWKGRLWRKDCRCVMDDKVLLTCTHYSQVILSHGLCHLAGHDHTTTELLEKMIKEENKLLCCYNNASGTALTSLTELDEK